MAEIGVEHCHLGYMPSGGVLQSHYHRSDRRCQISYSLTRRLKGDRLRDPRKNPFLVLGEHHVHEIGEGEHGIFVEH